MAQPSLSEQIRRLEAELGVALFARAGRRLELTEAGRLLVPQAERTLGRRARPPESVREVRTLTGGTVAFGTFGNAPYYLLSDLVQDFRAPPPGGEGAPGRPELVRGRRRGPRGRARGGADRAADRRPRARRAPGDARRDPVHAPREKKVREPMTIERLAEVPLILYDARFGGRPDAPPAAERAQRAGVKLEPEIEVEYIEAALDLAARGLGDTIAARTIALARVRAAAPDRLLRPPAVRHLRLRHPPRRPRLAGHARVHGDGEEARRAPRWRARGGCARLCATGRRRSGGGARPARARASAAAQRRGAPVPRSAGAASAAA